MAYYYMSSSQQQTNATINTDTVLASWTGIAGLRAYIRKIQCGIYAAPDDQQIRLRLQHSSTLGSAGTALTPQPTASDNTSAANLKCQTLPTVGALAAAFKVQLAFNQRGTSWWAAFVEDEAISVVGATAPNGEINLNSQATKISLPVAFQVTHSE